MQLIPPSLHEVLAAQKRLTPYLSPTALFSYPAINQLLGMQAYLKHENYQPIGAFKVRGGINLALQLSPAEKSQGLIAASTGNHGQSVAYAGHLFGIPAKIVVPEGANPGKVRAMQNMGAEVIFQGAKFDDARLHAEHLAQERGYRYVHAANEPHLIAGVATATLEILQAQPDIEVLIVPVGGGSGAAGACIAAHGINPQIKVIAVQSEKAPAAYLSWRDKTLTTAPNSTIIEGVATGGANSLTQEILWRELDDFVLLSDEAIMQGVHHLLEHAHTLAEGAGAAALAAAYHLRESLATKRVALMLSGGNISMEHLKIAMERYTRVQDWLLESLGPPHPPPAHR